MTVIIVENEADMESGLEVATALAFESGDNKRLEISFSSKGLMNIFMNNLFVHWVTERVPSNNNLDLHILVPEEIDDYDLGEWGSYD